MVSDSPGSFCRECGGPLRIEYYDVGGNVICSTCQETRNWLSRRMVRGLKALLFGALAAAVGAGVYRMIMFGTGWNFAVVAILVGYMVGGAVRTGSSERRGWFYQFLAVFLTYSALVGMFLPEVWRGLASAANDKKETTKQVEKEARKEVKADHGAKGEAKPAAPNLPNDQGKPPRLRGKHGLPYLVGMLLLTLLLMIGLVYCIPVVVGIHSPISLFIFGVALWQAWVMNRGSAPPVTGPYRLRT
jgi:hypothetical protein